ncbi:hypothetical protein TWF594_011802 [Orbilia oligospora]|nr:hypothetical protein TWF706_000836 [Orbilia oligospora]KAF3128083.1 hypothetical protein TWF594_011802 [Orbilia oligospora]
MDRFSVDQSGTTTAQTNDGAVMTNIAVWTPSDETAFENARSATVFTRIGTRHSPDELKAVLDATPTVKQTFCLSVNNVLLIFSDNIESHRADVRAVLTMLQGNSMKADPRDCVWDAGEAMDAGIRLEQVGEHKAYMVVNTGRPGA